MNKIFAIIGFLFFVGFFVTDLNNIANGDTRLVGYEIGDYYYIWIAFDLIMMFWFYRGIDK